MFKKHFIPNKHNDYKPYILRRRAVFFILKVVLVLEFLFLVQLLAIVPYTNFFSAILPNVLVDLTNSDRLASNLSALSVNPLLEKAAQMKAEDMAEKGYFSHNSPTGKTPWEWLDEVNYNFTYAGENLAVNFSDSKDIDMAWMNSLSHRENILNEHFTEIGIAAARGWYKNKESIFVVQFFGRPAKTTTVKQTAPIVAQNEVPPAQSAPEPEKPKNEENVRGEQSFIAIENQDQEPQQIAVVEPKASLFKKIFAMPKTILNYIYFLIALIVLLALMLKIFIKIKIQYPKLIFNGIILLFVIISILYFNSLVAGMGSVF